MTPYDDLGEPFEQYIEAMKLLIFHMSEIGEGMTALYEERGNPWPRLSMLDVARILEVSDKLKSHEVMWREIVVRQTPRWLGDERRSSGDMA
jgi:hypothetical protein